MKTIWKIAFVFLLTVGGIFAVSLNTLAAAKPYEYTFEKDNATFNGISSINKLVIKFFDKNITATVDNNNNIVGKPIYVVQKGGTERINIIEGVAISGKNLTVSFKNLDFIDYTNPEKLEYELVIDKETLQFDQLEEYRIPFNIYDILPGFKSTFIDTDASTINNNIFKINAPRDVLVHVPKIFIRGIETIHHNDGILPNSSPALTNIDILADQEATRLKVEFDGKPEYSRDLARHPEVEGFTMGQAGIKEIKDDQQAKEFSLRAYNDNGRFLEERKFKLKVDHQKNDYKINTYLPEPTKEFGQPYTLYDLMADPKLLNTIIERIPVSQLDSLGITYKTQNSFVEVNGLEKLKMALANPKVTTIKLLTPLNLGTDPLIIDRTVTIEGSPTVTGNVILGGTGTDIIARLNNITINGDLTVDVGTNGTAILDNVSVNGAAATTEIKSGGVNSVHLNNFESTNGIKLSNTAPLRVVASEPIDELLTLTGTGEVTLEGKFNTVKVTESTILARTKNTDIPDITVDSGKILTVKGVGYPIGYNTNTGSIIISSEEDSSNVLKTITWTYSESPLSDLFTDWNSPGVMLGLKDKEYETGKTLPNDIKWEVVGKSVFGENTSVNFNNSTGYLTIANVTFPPNETTITKEIVLQGIKDEVLYKVTIKVEVTAS